MVSYRVITAVIVFLTFCITNVGIGQPVLRSTTQSRIITLWETFSFGFSDNIPSAVETNCSPFGDRRRVGQAFSIMSTALQFFTLIVLVLMELRTLPISTVWPIVMIAFADIFLFITWATQITMHSQAICVSVALKVSPYDYNFGPSLPLFVTASITLLITFIYFTVKWATDSDEPSKASE